MAQRGHLFVVQADLTHLAADAFLIPCDTWGHVTGTWRSFIEPGARAQPAEQWFTVPDITLEDGVALLPDPTPEDAAPDEVVGVRVLVDTCSALSIPAMVERSLHAVRLAAERSTRHGGRHLPLVALPILGVGQGLFPGRRAEVIRELIGQLLTFVGSHPIDVALTVLTLADFAAAQWERQRQTESGVNCWPELTTAHADLADRLGGQAARGELSVFAGAGVSQPVGFPNWRQLLNDLAGYEIDFPVKPDYPKIAQEIGRPELNDDIAIRLTTRKHALGHALLVDLRTPATVTTNYDTCLENAAAVVHQGPRLRVLPRETARGGSPWLLKLHGDVKHPATIVFTRDQYTKLESDLSALLGVVQTLMLTSHLLFVGFSFADDDFLKLSRAVKSVRDLALDQEEGTRVGTAISLHPVKDRRQYSELNYHYLRDGGDLAEAARDLEIFLDRVAWRCQVAGRGRASYLLHPDYQQAASPPDEVLAAALTPLQEDEHQWQDSSGARAVRELIVDLGGQLG